MSDSNNIKSLQTEDDSSFDKDAMRQQLAAFEKFVARRFDEISMEINATSQLLDMAEDEAEQRFNNMLTALHTITELGDGKTSANSGAELEAAVKESEEAANKIMDAAENIGKLVEKTISASDNPETQYVLEEIDTHLQDILLACSFQDLVGQRIRTAMEQLRGVETELSETLTNMGLAAPKQDKKTDNGQDKYDGIATQDDIDALFD